MLTNSKQMSHDSCEASLVSDWLVSFNFSMARTKKMPQMGEGRKALQVKTWAEVQAAPVKPPVPAEPPVPDVEATPTPGEIERRRMESEKLEEAERSLESSPTQQLAQMAVETGPSTSGGEEPAKRKLQLTMGGKAPQKEFLKARKVKKSQRYWLGTVALHKICWFQSSTGLLIPKLHFSCLVNKIFLEVGCYDMHFQVHAILSLQEAAEAYLVGSWKMPTYVQSM